MDWMSKRQLVAHALVGTVSGHYEISDHRRSSWGDMEKPHGEWTIWLKSYKCSNHFKVTNNPVWLGIGNFTSPRSVFSQTLFWQLFSCHPQWQYKNRGWACWNTLRKGGKWPKIDRMTAPKDSHIGFPLGTGCHLDGQFTSPSGLRPWAWCEWPPWLHPVTQEEAGFNLYIYN